MYNFAWITNGFISYKPELTTEDFTASFVNLECLKFHIPNNHPISLIGDHSSMFVNHNEVNLEHGIWVSLAIIDSVDFYVGLSWPSSLTLLDYILWRDPGQIRKFPKWWEEATHSISPSGKGLVFYHNYYNQTEVEIYEDPPDLFVGFDNEIRAEAFSLIAETKKIDIDKKQIYYKAMNTIPNKR